MDKLNFKRLQEEYRLPRPYMRGSYYPENNEVFHAVMDALNHGMSKDQVVSQVKRALWVMENPEAPAALRFGAKEFYK